MAEWKDDFAMKSALLTRPGVWRFFALVLLAACGLGLYALLQFQGLRNPVVMEQADIARNLADGNGFTSHVIRPFDLWLTGTALDTVKGPVPALWHAPLYPRLLAWVFRMVQPAYAFSAQGIMDAETRGVIPLSIVLLLLATVATWFLARDLFDERCAHLASVIFLISPLPLRLVLEGGGLPLAMLLSVLLVWLVWKSVDNSFREDRRWLVPLYAAGAGVIGALAILSHYPALLIVFGAAVFLSLNLERLRWVTGAAFCSAVLLVLLPWFQTHHGGWRGFQAYPYGALLDTAIFSGDALLREGEPVLRSWQLTRALRDGMASRYLQLVTGQTLLAAGAVFVFFLTGMFRREERHWNQHWKWILAGVLLLQPVLPLVPGCAHGAWAMLFPLLTIYGVQTFCSLLDREDYFDVSAKPVLTGLFIVLCLLPAATGLLRQHDQPPYPPYHGPLQAYVGQWLPADQVMVTDIPWATAWYGRQPSLLWPNTAEDVALYGEAVAAMYLAGRQGLGTVADATWLRIRIDGVAPEGLPFQYGLFLPAGGRDQILLLRDAAAGTGGTSRIN